ncbi:MAG TPA: flagellar basal-body MS-ring/collar protein FliF [Phycisphaerae bacterium]|nr:flagellar basal-body MS-ring/collar protein FliF [Phycisphaerae bacterium]
MAKNLDNLREVWQRASLSQRGILLLVVAACVAAAALLVHWARQPKMALLYSRLGQEEAASIVEKVRDADVPFELKAGGTAVYVPAEKVYSLRLSLASQGLPTGSHEGYRLLDEEKIGASPFSQRVTYIRAVAGELARTIEMIDGVVSAKVHIAQPAPSLFGGRESKTKASVALKLRGGSRLGPDSISSIVHLVAGSIEGLEPGSVVVADSSGQLLSGQVADEMANGAGTYLDYKSRVESYVARKVEDLLSAVLGPNRARVRVDAVIDTSRSDTTKETYDPETTVVAREEITSSSSTTPSSAGAAAAEGVTRDETTVSEYNVSKTIETRRDLPGNVKSLTVAAFVDLVGPPPAKAADGSTPPPPAPKLKPEDIEAIILKATGVADATSVKVVPTSFHDPAAAAEGAEEADDGARWQMVLEIARRASLGILVIGALVVLKMFGGSRKRSASAHATLEEPGDAQAALEAPADAENLLTGWSGDVSPDVLRERITYALQENPEAVRRLFLTWARSEEGGR